MKWPQETSFQKSQRRLRKLRMKLSESKFVEMSGAQCPSLLSGRNLSQNFFRPLFSRINDTYLPLFVVKMGGVSGLC